MLETVKWVEEHEAEMQLLSGTIGREHDSFGDK